MSPATRRRAAGTRDELIASSLRNPHESPQPDPVGADRSCGAARDRSVEARAYFAAIIGTGKGLVADFFSDNNLTNLVAARTDATVNFVWGTGSPGTGIPAEGLLDALDWAGAGAIRGGVHVLHRLGRRRAAVLQRADGDQRLGLPRTRPMQATTAKLTAGQLYDVQLEYRDQGTSAVRLLWSSTSTPKAIIPTTQLYRVGSAR